MLSRVCCYCCDKNDKAIKSSQPIVEIPITIQPTRSKKFTDDCLREHNRLRALHGCPPLRLSQSLTAYATEWATILAERNTILEYRNEGRCGENIYVARGCDVDAWTVVRSWYDGVALYSFENPGYVYGVDPFTQMMWKDTNAMGVGVCMGGGNKWIVVNYTPKGNIAGSYEENVPRLIK